MFTRKLCVYLYVCVQYFLIGALDHECFINDTIHVVHPAPGTFGHVVAVVDESDPSASECTTSISGSLVIITGCSKGDAITLHFSNQSAADPANSIIGGISSETYKIQCDEIADAGVDRSVANVLGITLELTSQSLVTPAFTVTSAIRGHSSPDASVVSYADVGTDLYWTIDVPSEFDALPTCTAYSGATGTGLRLEKTLFLDGCQQDDGVVSDNFDSIYDQVPLISRYYVTMYAFRFYDSPDVYFECTVKICPSGASSCSFNCGGGRKRSVNSRSVTEQDHVFKTTSVLHILHDSSSTTATGNLWLLLAAIIAKKFWSIE